MKVCRPRSVRPFAGAFDPPPDAGAELLAQIVDRVLGSPARRGASYRVRLPGGLGAVVDALLTQRLAGEPERLRRLLAEPCVLRRGRALLELLAGEEAKRGN